MDAMEKYLRGDASLYRIDYRIRDVYGEYHWYMDRGVWQTRDAAGRISSMLGVVIDLGSYIANDAFIPAIRKLVHAAVQGTDTPRLCVQCGSLHTSSGQWALVEEEVLEQFPQVVVSHTICPSCIRKLYPELADHV
ncbi:hypothetical protein CALK_1810 [Chitinivibrio alkaliphilus ACht1]|uniref:PAS fold-3 domain-containing protein n=2 Tax=Chitinivibrio TaxID=1505231 RepID=U7D6Y4_9BACT|nr:hypothetical protein CALK_1810 [Chitinivibrio alkaliphilus ACht1]